VALNPYTDRIICRLVRENVAEAENPFFIALTMAARSAFSDRCRVGVRRRLRNDRDGSDQPAAWGRCTNLSAMFLPCAAPAIERLSGWKSPATDRERQASCCNDPMDDRFRRLTPESSASTT